MAFDSNKISNILGSKIPQWLINQLDTRSIQGAKDVRDNDNVLFIANKTAWIRLVSSIDIINPSDIDYFRRVVGDSIKNKEDLAKQFVLFGGTSKYLRENSYQQRSGLGKDGAYGILGTDEIQQFGYKPMPGITSVTIDTQGKLGSLRAATISFKCWDKAQLDIIDALYFKLGFTMFLEWGQTFFYPQGSNRIQSTELYSIDPFRKNLTKEEIAIQISKNIRQSEGNYDALLGMVTNFNFTYNQDGGYDCTLKLMALGILGDAIKINNPKDLPNILAEEIKQYNNTLIQIATAEERERLLAQQKAAAEEDRKKREQLLSVEELIKKYITYNPNNQQVLGGIYSYPSNAPAKFEFADLSFNTEAFGRITVIRRLKGFISEKEDLLKNTTIKLDPDRIVSLIDQTKINLNSLGVWGSLDQIIETDIKSEARNNFAPGTWKWTSINGSEYELSIKRRFWAVSQNPKAVETFIPIKIEEFSNQFLSVIKQTNNTFKISSIGQPSRNTFSYTVTFSIPFSRDAQVLQPQKENPDGTLSPLTSKIERVQYNLEVEFTFEDSSFIKSFTTPEKVIQPIDFLGNQAAIASQNQNQAPTQEDQAAAQEASNIQIQQSLQLQSGLELTLRTIQVHALNKAINQTKTPDLEIGRKVYKLPIWDKNDKTQGGTPFYTQIFSNGIFSNCITRLIEKGISDVDPKNPKDRFEIQSKYGFATELMSGRITTLDLKGKEVNFEELLNAYVVPYQVNQEIVKGVNTNHPVYIPLGLLLMILNHNCTIYDTKDSATQTPLVYIDFNPNVNFFLTNTKHLSTNPFKVLIPFEGGFSDYQQLFTQDVLTTDKINILPLSGSSSSTPLFNTANQDALSSQIPPIKFGESNDGIYRGKMMNVLLNIDYVIQLVRDYSLKDGTNSIYLKSFLEQIILDINKYLGNFSILRLAYNDGGNTFHIVDDQVIPTLPEEEMLEPDNVNEIPLVGKYSIAKSLEIKSDVSTKLSNMIAISANSDVEGKSTLSTNGDSFGFINTSYKDRFIPIKGDVTGSVKSNQDTVKAAAIQFNQTISDFYSKINPSEANVSQATNYYIERMSKVKNDEYPTRASAMIPVSVNFTTDGISGFTMGQAFTVSNQLLPYTYNNRIVNQQGLSREHVNKVGFVVVGLTNTIENNQWNTAVRANMIFLKYKSDFVGSIKRQVNTNAQFGVNPVNENESIPTKNTNFIGTNADAKKVAETYLGKSLTDQEWSQLVAATFAEASSNQEERAWIMAVILNRTRTRFLGAQTITDTLTRKRQFQAVTGTSANNYQPSSNYVNGPSKTQADSIYGSVINFLSTVPKNYLYFTSNVAAAYGPGTSIAFLDKLKSLPGSKIIGKTVFATTA